MRKKMMIMLCFIGFLMVSTLAFANETELVKEPRWWDLEQKAIDKVLKDFSPLGMTQKEMAKETQRLYKKTIEEMKSVKTDGKNLLFDYGLIALSPGFYFSYSACLNPQEKKKYYRNGELISRDKLTEEFHRRTPSIIAFFTREGVEEEFGVKILPVDGLYRSLWLYTSHGRNVFGKEIRSNKKDVDASSLNPLFFEPGQRFLRDVICPLVLVGPFRDYSKYTEFKKKYFKMGESRYSCNENGFRVSSVYFVKRWNGKGYFDEFQRGILYQDPPNEKCGIDPNPPWVEKEMKQLKSK